MSATKSPHPGIQTTTLSNIQRQNVSWIWEPRIPRREITLIQGDPGVGKSFLMGHVIACLTSGKPLPGMTAPIQPLKVLIFCEDNPGTVVRPRLEDMAADLKQIEIFTGYFTGHSTTARFSLDKVTDLEHCLQQHRPDLVLIDPLMSFVGLNDPNKGPETRALLDPLVGLAAQYNLAFVCNMHCNKNDVKALYKGSGSIQFAGTARSVLFVERDPLIEEERVLCHVKTNVGREAPSLNFVIGECGVQTDPTKIRFGIGVNWIAGKEGRWTPNELLDGGTNKRGGKLDTAKAFLRALLHRGPVAVGELDSLAEELKIAKRTLERARNDLQVQPTTLKVNGQIIKAVCLPGYESANQQSSSGQEELLARVEEAVKQVVDETIEQLEKGWRSGGLADRHAAKSRTAENGDLWPAPLSYSQQ